MADSRSAIAEYRCYVTNLSFNSHLKVILDTYTEAIS